MKLVGRFGSEYGLKRFGQVLKKKKPLGRELAGGLQTLQNWYELMPLSTGPSWR